MIPDSAFQQTPKKIGETKVWLNDFYRRAKLMALLFGIGF
jgi:hypothetical protein